jgi:hypothetical protein
MKSEMKKIGLLRGSMYECVGLWPLSSARVARALGRELCGGGKIVKQ